MLITYPMNDADFGAADAELFHCTRNSGVFDGEDFACSANGADNKVTVGIGIGWIRNTRFKGKVVAQKEPMVLDMGVTHATYPRIDAVVIRFEENVGTDIVVKNGTAAADPKPPEVVRTEAVYELHLYHVRREAGAAAIPVSALTDLRLIPEYCGLMQDDVTPRGGNIAEEQLPVVPVEKGGTEATTAAEARANLGVPAVNETFSLVKLGDAIPQNADMNTYRTPGSYYCESGTIAATIKNAPFSAFGFRLIVFRGYSSRIHQMAIGNSNELKLRTYTGTAWVDGWGSTQQPTLKSLLAADYMVMSSYQIVDSVDDIPADAPDGSLFLVPMEE